MQRHAMRVSMNDADPKHCCDSVHRCYNVYRELPGVLDDAETEQQGVVGTSVGCAVGRPKVPPGALLTPLLGELERAVPTFWDSVFT